MPTLLTSDGRDRGADRASRDPLPRQSGRRRPLRAPLRLDGRAAPRPCRRTIGSSRPRATGIARLNARHGRAPAAARASSCSTAAASGTQAKGEWMGWERKRGKLHELNRLLRGATDTTFLAAARRPDVPAGVRYVITLDADTRLPRGAANRLVGTMAHPLNRPVFDPARGPRRRGLRRASAARSRPRCLRIATGRSSSGSSPVRRASIPMPPRSPTSTRISSARARTPARASTTWTRSTPRWPAASPRTALLSHDLFEGIFARAGTRHRHRAVRGVPAALRGRRRAPAPLGARRLAAAALDLRATLARGRGAPSGSRSIGRWKMLDNLRRTLSAPAAC